MNKSQFHPLLSVTLLVALILSACAPTFMQVSTPTPASVRFEQTACMFGEAMGIDCGYLYVPEDRSQPGGPQIKLAVAILRSSNPNPAPDPVLLLISWLGGPGSQFLEYTASIPTVLKGILADRDVIMFDRRGSGYSLPELECPEVEKQILQDLPQNLSQEESQRHNFQAYQTCHDRLEQEGINLSLYTNTADAADVNDLRTALGYTEWNIVGDTYGARLALQVMREFPAGVRSVVLDSVYPPQANMDTEAAANAERALKLLFERCAADDACNADYPDLETVFYDAAAQLDTNPISIDLTSQQTRQKVTLLINGDRMINLIIHLLSFGDMLPYIPKWIYEFYEGNAGSDFMLKGYMQFFPFSHEISSEGKGLSIQCGEKIISSSAQAAETANTEVHPRLLASIDQGRYLALCPAWGVEPVTETEIQPVVSDIPTLLLTGDNDPGSPPAWGTSTAENLSYSHYFELPWASRGLLYGTSPASICARSIIDDFIADPATTPDSACIDNLSLDFLTK